MWLSGTYLVMLWIVTIVVGHMLVSANLLVSKGVVIAIVINNLPSCCKLHQSPQLHHCPCCSKLH